MRIALEPTFKATTRLVLLPLTLIVAPGVVVVGVTVMRLILLST